MAMPATGVGVASAFATGYMAPIVSKPPHPHGAGTVWPWASIDEDHRLRSLFCLSLRSVIAACMILPSHVTLAPTNTRIIKELASGY
jgi:hypothetical protein